MQTLRDHVSSVYDITVVYEGPNKVNNRTPPPSMFSKWSHLQDNVVILILLQVILMEDVHVYTFT